jgi:hypothetical protein
MYELLASATHFYYGYIRVGTSENAAVAGVP